MRSLNGVICGKDMTDNTRCVPSDFLGRRHSSSLGLKSTGRLCSRFAARRRSGISAPFMKAYVVIGTSNAPPIAGSGANLHVCLRFGDRASAVVSARCTTDGQTIPEQEASYRIQRTSKLLLVRSGTLLKICFEGIDY